MSGWHKGRNDLWRDVAFTSLTDGAQALWHRAMSYISDQMSDGVIPDGSLKHLNTRKRYVDELVAKGFWVRRSTGGWLAAGWQEMVRSKDAQLASRSQTLQRVNRHRNGVSNAGCNAAQSQSQRSEISSSKKELDQNPLFSKTTEKLSRGIVPIGEPPADVMLEPRPLDAASEVFKLWERESKQVGLLGHPAIHRQACSAVACASQTEAGVDAWGPDAERAAQRRIRVWLDDKWVVENKPSIRHLAANLNRYTKQAPAVSRYALRPGEESDTARWRRWERENAEQEERHEAKKREIARTADRMRGPELAVGIFGAALAKLHEHADAAE